MSPKRDPNEEGRLIIPKLDGGNEAPMFVPEEYLAEDTGSHFLNEEKYHNRKMTWGEYCLMYQLDPSTGENFNSIGSRRVVEDAAEIPEPLEPATRGMSADDFQEGMREMKAFEAQRPKFLSLQVYSSPHDSAPLEGFGFEAVVTDAGGLQARGFLSGSEIAAFGRWLLETYDLPGRINVASVGELQTLASSFLTNEILLNHPFVRDAINQFVQALEERH